MTKHITRTIAIVFFGSMLAASACDSKDDKDGKDSKVAKKDGKTAVTKIDAKEGKKTGDTPDEKADTKDDTKAGEPTTPTEPPPPKEDDVDAVKVAAIAKEIEANPADTDKILEKNGMDRAKFETSMAAIAKDELKSDMYIQALTAESKGTG